MVAPEIPRQDHEGHNVSDRWRFGASLLRINPMAIQIATASLMGGD